jgi:mRNA-degrading endonuclease toxin of MazEF toxin-antitoxin module
MPYRGPVRQWDAFVADLDLPGGSEQGGNRRLVIVVSNDGFNQAFSIVTVVPLTTTDGKRRRVYPFEIVIPPGLLGNPRESIIMPYQIRTIDKARLFEPMGRLEDTATRGAIEDRIIEHIGVDLDADER